MGGIDALRKTVLAVWHVNNMELNLKKLQAKHHPIQRKFNLHHLSCKACNIHAEERRRWNLYYHHNSISDNQPIQIFRYDILF